MPEIWQQLKPWRALLGLAGIFFLVQGICSLGLIVLARKFAPFFEQPELRAFAGVLGAVIVVYLLRFAAEYLQWMSLEKLVAQWLVQQREQVFEHLFQAQEQGSAEHCLTVLGDDLERVRDACLSALHRFFPSLIMLLGLLGVLFYLSWPLSLGLVLGIPVFIALSQFLGRQLAQAAKSRQDSLSLILEELGESLRHFTLLRLYQQQTAQQERLKQAQQHWLKHHLDSLRWQHLERPFMGALQVLALGGVLLLAVFLIQQNWLDAATLLAYATAIGLAVDPGLWLGESWVKIQAGRPSWERVQALQCLPLAPLQLRETHADLSLRLEGLSFQREGRWLFQGLQAQIRAGQYIALCGPSGAGKSTLLKVLIGLEAPTAGQILWPESWTPERVLMVPQRAGIFQRSLRDNLCLNQNYPEAQIWQVLEMCELKAFVQALPQGLETHLGQRRLRLSGGEMQRIALARALLRQPQLLILDEACSELDADNETRIMQALVRHFPEMACILVAHHGTSLHFVEQLWHLNNADWKVEDVQTADSAS